MRQHNSMKRICLVVPALAMGGGVPSVARFIKDVVIRSGRFELSIVSLSMSSSDTSSTQLRWPLGWLYGAKQVAGTWEGLPFVHVGAEWGELEFQRYRPRRALREVIQDSDILQVVCGSPAWANTVVGLGKPVSLQVATLTVVERRMRDANLTSITDWWRKAMTKVTNRLDNRALRAVDAIQLENPWMLEYARQTNAGRLGVDIRYAPPGVDTAVFHPLVERPKLPNRYILCVGRLDDPRKNIELLLAAFQRLPLDLCDVHLITAGSSRPRSGYWAKVEAFGLQDRVHHILKPETDELVKLYQNATAFALSSDEEGLGVVILEAMACGVPVVATRCGGPDGIITEGVDGFLVPLNDEAAMSDRLARLCGDSLLNQRMGRAARETIESRYASDVAGQAFVAVWDRLLKQKGRF